jgi:hypothetical protein
VYPGDDKQPFFHWTLFDESILYEHLLTSILNDYVDDARAFSPMSMLFENQILKAVLAGNDGKLPSGFIACWFPKFSNDGWCGQCTKCLRYHQMFTELGVTPPFEMRGTANYMQNLTPQDLFSDESKKMYTYREMYIPSEVNLLLRDLYDRLIPDVTANRSSDIIYPPSGLYLP